MQKTKRVNDLKELRYKLAEKMAAYEDGEIDGAQAKVYIGFGTVLVNSCKVEVIRQHFTGVINNIDFVENSAGSETKVKGLTSEFFGNHEKSEAS